MEVILCLGGTFIKAVAIAYKFKTDEDALNLANGLDTGLVAVIFTRDLSKALLIKDELEFGSVWINGWFIVYKPQMVV